MQLYFSPLACSMATRISLYEAGAEADVTFVEVDPKTKLTGGGDDFRRINPLGLVPTVRTTSGEVITENAAILQYVAEQYPSARLVPEHRMARTRLHQWLCFIGTELHKGTFTALLDRTAPEGARTYALEKSKVRFAYLEQHLSGREYLLDEFSVADAYLVTVLGWAIATPIELSAWPAVHQYFKRILKRPSVARAFAEERTLYAKELERHEAM